jgi:predicted ATPase
MNLTAQEHERLAAAVQSAARSNQRQHTAWRVLTGAPASGKTTLLRELETRGYPVVEDSARALLLEDIASGVPRAALRQDYLSLQRRVLERTLSLAKRLDPGQPAFFDYGFADSLAFLKAMGLPWEEVFVTAGARVVFAAVYVLEPLQIPPEQAAADPVRTESERLRSDLHTLLLQIYTSLGAHPILVPVVPPERRVQLILEGIKPCC